MRAYQIHFATDSVASSVNDVQEQESTDAT